MVTPAPAAFLIVARPAPEAKNGLKTVYGAWKLKRIVQTILSCDVRPMRFVGWKVISVDRAVSIIVETWSRCKKDPTDIRKEDVFSANDLKALDEQAQKETGKIKTKDQMRDGKLRKPSKVTRRGLFRRRAEGCAVRLYPNKSQLDQRRRAKDTIFANITAMDLDKPLTKCEYCHVDLNFDARGSRGAKYKRKNNPHVFSVDAFVPRASGGDYSRDNLRVSCWACNVLKDDQSPEFLHRRLRARSQRPALTPRMVFSRHPSFATNETAPTTQSSKHGLGKP